MKIIVVSAVSLRKGGTLSILRECLRYLSGLAETKQYRVIAIVHKKELASFPNIEYIEMPNIIKNWYRRLWCEYVTFYSLSRQIGPVYLWLSLHDTTPNVSAERRAVYCQTSFPFMKWKWKDLIFDYKIVLFTVFTRYVYKINVKKNTFLIVQTDWLRDGFSKMFGVDRNKFIVARPGMEKCLYDKPVQFEKKKSCYKFIYAATPDCHKNFEQICKACVLLEKEIGSDRFEVALTIKGDENKYASWLYRKWGNLKSLNFEGFMSREKLYVKYDESDCLIFPSRIETWGLPISEFGSLRKSMLLVDLPYAHETSEGFSNIAFFKIDDFTDLAIKMKRLIEGDNVFLGKVESRFKNEPKSNSWDELFQYLLL